MSAAARPMSAAAPDLAPAEPVRSPWLTAVRVPTAEDVEQQLGSLFLSDSLTTDKFVYVTDFDAGVISTISLTTSDGTLDRLGHSLEQCRGDDFKMPLRLHGAGLTWKISIEARNAFRAVMQDPDLRRAIMQSLRILQHRRSVADTITRMGDSILHRQAAAEWETAEAGKREAWIGARRACLEAEKIAESAAAEEEADRQLAAEIEARRRRRQAAAALLGAGHCRLACQTCLSQTAITAPPESTTTM